MVRMRRQVWLGVLLWVSAAGVLTRVQAQELPSQPAEITLADDLRLVELRPGLWRHVSTFVLVSRPTPANGLLLMTETEALLIDTPWTDDQTERLLDWIERDRGLSVAGVIATHFHSDCMGGIGAVHRREIPTYGLSLTADLAREADHEPPTVLFTGSMGLTVGGETVELFYPGPGHSHDNIVVWLESYKVLFGGCLVKNATTRHIGYLGDAEVDSWGASVEKMRARYPEAALIVPGHGQPGGWDLVENTLALIAEQ
ncbi:MAG: subclass B1 metallo-beta-lactamase [Thermoanaerobaculia bacterium]